MIGIIIALFAIFICAIIGYAIWCSFNLFDADDDLFEYFVFTLDKNNNAKNKGKDEDDE